MRVIVISNNFGLIVTFPIITHIFNDHLGLSCLKFKQWLFVVMLLQPNWIFFELNKKEQHRIWLSNVMSVSLPKFQSLLLNSCTYTYVIKITQFTSPCRRVVWPWEEIEWFLFYNFLLYWIRILLVEVYRTGNYANKIDVVG